MIERREVADRSIPAVGFGAMPLSTAGRPERRQAIEVLHAVLDAGVRLVDTADAYCLGAADTGHNEELVAEALRTWSGDADEVLVSTKGGSVRGADGSWDQDGRPEHLREACDASLRRLGVEAIGLYHHHRPDPKVPYLDSIGAVAELQAAGKVRHVGISNADVEQIEAATGVVAVASVQNELSPAFRSSLGEARRCAELGLAFLAWGPLGGAGRAAHLGEDHPAFAEVASERGVSPQQIAIAWSLRQGGTVVPIPGARRTGTALDSIAGADLRLTDDEVRRLDAARR